MGWTLIQFVADRFSCHQRDHEWRGREELAEGMEHLGIPLALASTLAIIELTCVIVYAIPLTSVIGAILLTGYMGGAIFAHLRVGIRWCFRS